MKMKAKVRHVFEGKLVAVFFYLTILCIIPLILKRDDDFILSHGKQGLVLFVAEAAVFIAHIALGPSVLRLGLFILISFSLWGIFEALRGQYAKLPVIANPTDKIVL